jgi:hypothetical protein
MAADPARCEARARDPPALIRLGSALLVVASIPQARGDAIGRGDEVWTERVHELSERDHRAVRREVDRGDDPPRLVAHGRGDRE